MADDDDDDAGGSGSELGADEVAAGGTPSRRTDARTQKDREAIIITEALSQARKLKWKVVQYKDHEYRVMPLDLQIWKLRSGSERATAFRGSNWKHFQSILRSGECASLLPHTTDEETTDVRAAAALSPRARARRAHRRAPPRTR